MKNTIRTLLSPSQLLLVSLVSLLVLLTGCGSKKADEERAIKLRGIRAKYQEPWTAYRDAIEKVHLRIEEYDADSLGDSPDFDRATADTVWKTVRALQPQLSLDLPYGKSNYLILPLNEIGGKMEEELSLYESNTWYAGAMEFMNKDTSGGYFGYEEPLTIEANMSQVSLEKIPYLIVYNVFASLAPEVEDLSGFEGGIMIAQIFLFDLRTQELIRRGAIAGENSDNVNYTHTEGSDEQMEFLSAAKADLATNTRKEIMDWVKALREPEIVEDEAEDDAD